MEELVQYHIDDYSIFETVLESDYYSIMNILINEGLYDGMDDKDIYKFNKKLNKRDFYELILNTIDKIKEKINQMIDKLISILDEKEIKKWKKKIESNKDLLMNTDFKDFRIESNCPDKEAMINLKTKIFNIGATNSYKYMNITDEMISKLKDKIKNVKKEREEIHNDIWWIKVSDYKYITDFNFLLNEFELALKNLRTAQKLKNDINKHHTDLKRDLQRSKDLYYNKSDKQIMERYKRDMSYIKLNGVYMINSIKTLIIEQRNILNWYKKCLISLLGYAKKQSKNKNESYIDYDMEYINAVSESTIYELECEVE